MDNFKLSVSNDPKIVDEVLADFQETLERASREIERLKNLFNFLEFLLPQAAARLSVGLLQNDLRTLDRHIKSVVQRHG